MVIPLLSMSKSIKWCESQGWWRCVSLWVGWFVVSVVAVYKMETSENSPHIVLCARKVGNLLLRHNSSHTPVYWLNRNPTHTYSDSVQFQIEPIAYSTICMFLNECTHTPTEKNWTTLNKSRRKFMHLNYIGVQKSHRLFLPSFVCSCIRTGRVR